MSHEPGRQYRPARSSNSAKAGHTMDRRAFANRSAAVAGAVAIGDALVAPEPADAQQRQETEAPLPEAVRRLRPMSPPVTPISDEERLARIEKARGLLRENGMAAMFLEPGSSMFYYTGVRWGLSERPFGVLIPATGDLAYITPAFEEERGRELIKFSNDVRVWQEDESPYRLVADILRDRGIATGKVGFEERLRFFIAEGIRKEAPQLEYAIATPVTAGCRMLKSPAE